MTDSSTPRIFADFHNSDRLGRVRLNTVGTAENLSRLGLDLSEGVTMAITDNEFEADAVATYSEEEQLWVAKIDWGKIQKLPLQS